MRPQQHSRHRDTERNVLDRHRGVAIPPEGDIAIWYQIYRNADAPAQDRLVMVGTERCYRVDQSMPHCQGAKHGLAEEATRNSNGAFHGPFREDAHCHIYNLHGGLHLFEDSVGKIHKAVHGGPEVIATITDAIAIGRRLPVYVAEGLSMQKMRNINSVPDLRYCYESLIDTPATMLVYGHSTDENDAHIYRAIFGSSVKHFYFGVYKSDDAKLNSLDRLLAKH